MFVKSKLAKPLFFRLLTSSRLLSSIGKEHIDIRQNVLSAVRQHRPVVALESTIITHGMPYPENMNTAYSVENIIEEKGGTPATIGIMNGKLTIGLSKEEIKYLAENTEGSVKTSRRDLAYVLSKNLNGGTTVSATMLAAQYANIPLFVTGGIGGVHRGASETFDISADLKELGQTSVAVVCAGVKSILDVGLTLEYLETQGVPVISYNTTKEFPSFFSSKSGYNAPYNLSSPKDIAECLFAHNSLNLHSGMLIAAPIPEEYSIDNKEIENVIQTALKEARKKGIVGKEITPFVLEHVSRMSQGKSLEANIKLIENNANIGVDIAIEYSKLQQGMRQKYPQQTISNSQRNNKEEVINVRNVNHNVKKRPVVIGGSVLDIKATPDQVHGVAESTNTGKLHLSDGGVARNIAEFLTRCETNPLLISAVGDDHLGNIIMQNMRKIGMDDSGMSVSTNQSTATCSIMASQATGEVMMAVGDMNINETISMEMISEKKDEIQSASIVVFDANVPVETIEFTIDICNRNNVPVWFEPTCLQKAGKPFAGRHRHQHIQFASPNIVELNSIKDSLQTKGEFTPCNKSFEDLDLTSMLHECVRLSKQCNGVFENFVVTLGKHGVLLVTRKESRFSDPDAHGEPRFLHFKAVPDHLSPVTVKSVSGAGDSLAAGIIYGVVQDYELDACVKAGLLGAYKSLSSYSAISSEICPDLLSIDSVQQWAPFNPEYL